MAWMLISPFTFFPSMTVPSVVTSIDPLDARLAAGRGPDGSWVEGPPVLVVSGKPQLWETVFVICALGDGRQLSPDLTWGAALGTAAGVLGAADSRGGAWGEK